MNPLSPMKPSSPSPPIPGLAALCTFLVLPYLGVGGEDWILGESHSLVGRRTLSLACFPTGPDCLLFDTPLYAHTPVHGCWLC